MQLVGATLMPLAVGALMSCTAVASEPKGAAVAAPAPSQVRPEDGADLAGMQVRNMQSVPILADAVMLHEPLGECHNCHVILPAGGQVALARRTPLQAVAPWAPAPMAARAAMVPPAVGRVPQARCVERPAPPFMQVAPPVM